MHGDPLSAHRRDRSFKMGDRTVVYDPETPTAWVGTEMLK